MIKVTLNGNFKKTNKYFKKAIKVSKIPNIELFAKTCVEELKKVTPIESGLTAESWYYKILKKKESSLIEIGNKNIQNGVNIALLLEYGHGTRSGSWVEGKNFIEPSIVKTFLDLRDSVWKEMTEL